MYETIHDRPPAYCNISSTIDCGKVEFSPYSHFLGVPDALLGLFFFVVMIVLWSLSLPQFLRYWWVIGVLFSIYLIYTETLIGAICLYCSLAQAYCVVQGLLLRR
ncbi:vitamin K epoxide reductase family protein [Metallosphaera hakonensis]|uniref:vitamin K epoxide reductase family protein n=1 Tax=Metallosphaera hakonensis TaxID=79601 RepID=UPI000A497703|nr:vitamin K epoxide reductase family protein [Metallosphaera hakonensis]